MNFKDIPTEGLIKAAQEVYGSEHPYQIIFGRQTELIGKYHQIEEDVLERPISLPPHLHDARGQDVLKQRAWWVTEELSEAVDAFLDDEDKMVEELADALHFYTELLILSGITWEDAVNCGYFAPRNFPFKCEDWPPRACFSLKVMAIIRELGMAMWQLRNKPWKQTQITTDIQMYCDRLIRGYNGLLVLIEGMLGADLEEVTLLYLRKSEVNKFRIRSKY